MSENGRIGGKGESERRTGPPGRFRVVAAPPSETISVAGEDANGRKGKGGASDSLNDANWANEEDAGKWVDSANKEDAASGGDSIDKENAASEALRLNASTVSAPKNWPVAPPTNLANSAFFDAETAPSETTDDEFDDENAFFASFSAGAAAREGREAFDDAFAGGLRSIFDAETDDETLEKNEEDGADENDVSDAERFQRDLERERRESLDVVLLQNDADFLREAGEKYERARVSDADFERKRTSASNSWNERDGRNERDGQAGQVGRDGQSGRIGASERSEPNGRSGQFEQGGRNGQGGGNGGNGEDGATATGVEATGGRRVPIGPASILEAMLFVGDRENRPLTLARATELMRNVSETEAIEALADLNERYWRDGAPYRIVRDGDGFRMALRPEFDALAARFVGGKTKEFKLTQTMIDVLALIAYRQPISLDEILETRNNATGALSQLVKRELVAQEKRVVDKKKVAFYSTTPRFLRLFNLESLDDLPIVGDVDYR